MPVKARKFLAVGVTLELGLILLAAVFAKLARIEILSLPVSFEPRSVITAIFATLPPAAFAVFATSPAGLRLAPMRSIHDLIKEALGEPLKGMSFWGILMISSAAGLGEEILFRGVMMPWVGVVAANIVFGVCHAANLPMFLFATGMGFYLGAVYSYSGNLLTPILVHALYDAVALRLYQRRFHGAG